jgi:hypothetical protein
MGLRVWNADSGLRLDTRARTMRLAQKIWVPGRSLGGTKTYSQTFALPGFNPERDGAFLIGGEAGALAYDGGGAGYLRRFIPEFYPAMNKITLVWRGFGVSYALDAQYMACYIMVLRAD